MEMMLALVLAAAPQLLPVDEAKRNPGFVAFRAQLSKAIRKRDFGFLMAHVAPEVRTSFGDDKGKADFVRQWRPSPKSQIWSELGAVVRLGGAWQGSTFWAPYVYAKWPEKYDPFEHFACVDPKAKLYATPGGRAIAPAGYAILRSLPPPRRSIPGWVHVAPVGGRDGYVRETAVRRSTDYRAAFEKRKGVWMLTAFVAGD